MNTVSSGTEDLCGTRSSDLWTERDGGPGGLVDFRVAIFLVSIFLRQTQKSPVALLYSVWPSGFVIFT